MKARAMEKRPETGGLVRLQGARNIANPKGEDKPPKKFIILIFEHEKNIRRHSVGFHNHYRLQAQA